ncbi:hypothetical protein [Mesorhizobium sp. M0619]|uniref:hypothetical protein n=1 Tax=unclassified Mesorhizobium TaxID=325217 RepID=UPI003334BD9F
MWGLDTIKSELQVLKGAPFSVCLLVAAGLWGGYQFASVLTAERIATLETMVHERDGEIEGYQKTLSDRLDKVEKALSDQQLSSIKSSLKDGHGSVDILDSNPDKPDPRADQLKTAFRDSGWDVMMVAKNVTDAADLVLRTTDPKAATSVEKALRDAGVTYQMATPPGNTGTDFLLRNSK